MLWVDWFLPGLRYTIQEMLGLRWAKFLMRILSWKTPRVTHDTKQDVIITQVTMTPSTVQLVYGRLRICDADPRNSSRAAESKHRLRPASIAARVRGGVAMLKFTELLSSESYIHKFCSLTGLNKRNESTRRLDLKPSSHFHK